MKNLFKRTPLMSAMGGICALLLSTTSSAATIDLAWSGSFTMVNQFGAALMNSSIPIKEANQYQTPITGTLTLDTVTNQGVMTIAPFDWQNQPADVPSVFHDIQFELIGDGFGGPGTLALGNMLYDWNGTTNLGVSMVWDMAGLLGAVGNGLAIGDVVEGVGVLPASDGIFTPYGPDGTYLSQGLAPVATTTYDTTSAADCQLMDCQNVNPSGLLPLVVDTSLNVNESTVTETVYGIGGSPVQDGPWSYKNFNIDITQMLVVNEVTAVPVPAALWLFGSGLAGLLITGRRRLSR